LDRRIVTLQAVLPVDVVGAQAQGTGERRGDEGVGIIGTEARDVGECGDGLTMATARARDNPAAATTPQVGGAG